MKSRRIGRGADGGRRRREAGMVLAMAAIVIFILLVMALPLLTRLSAEHGTTTSASKGVSALCLAEAGVEKAVRELNRGSWVGTEDLGTDLRMALDQFATPGGAIVGDIDITVKPYNRLDQTRVVEVTGSAGGRGPSRVAKAVRVTLLKPRRPGSPADRPYIISAWHELPAGL
jgi:hypothetical protein